MGRRRLHHPVDDKGDGQKIGHRMHEPKLSKPKHAINDESRESDGVVHQRSKVTKRGNKRKRDDVTRKGHAQRHKPKDPYGSSKMLSKQKTKKFSRWKSFSGSDSDLSSGKGSDSSMRFTSISNSSCSGSSDDSSYSSCSREQTRKRSRAHSFEDGQIIETVNKERRKRVSRSRRRDEPICTSRLKVLRGGDHQAHWHENTAGIVAEGSIQGNACFQSISFDVEGQHSKFMDGQAPEVCVSTALEQETGQLNMNASGEEAGSNDGATKASFLEIELRQKALANLMRHRDSTCGRKIRKEICNSFVPIIQDVEKRDGIVEEVRASTNQHSISKEGNEIDKGSAVETGNLLGVVNVIRVHDGNIDENRWPLAIDIAPQRTYSLEPKQDSVEDSTPSSHVALKLVAVGNYETLRKSKFEEEKFNRSSDQLSLEATDSSHKDSLLPSENESQLETTFNFRNTDEISRNRDSCKDIAVSGEENIPVMANYVSEVVKAEASQAEVKGNSIVSEPISTNAVHLSESVGLLHGKVCSNLEQVNKDSNDKVELLEARESPISIGLLKEERIEDTNTGYNSVTAVKQKSPTEKKSPDSFRDSGRDHGQSVHKAETAPQKQEDGASVFQQKTMSVMRGGELVQVNYKVYIPKRAAELAKRKLQR